MGSWNIYISSTTFIHIFKIIQFIPFSSTFGDTGIPNFSDTVAANSDYNRVKFGSLHTFKILSEWSALEENISIVLTERLDYLLKEEKLIATYLKDYNETSGEALANFNEPKVTPKERGEVIGSSAVLGHRMITRYTSTVAQLKELLKSPGYKESEERVNTILNYDGTKQINPNTVRMEWPVWQDKYMSSLAFLHLMEIHGFMPRDIQSGLKVDANFGGRLTAHDSAEIGIFALYKKYYYMSIQWLEFAKALIIGRDTSVELDLVQSMLNIAIQEHNEIWKVMQTAKNSNLHPREYLKLMPNQYNNPILEIIPEESRTTVRAVMYSDGKLDKSPNSLLTPIANFADLCSKQGDYLKSEKERAKLKCYYETKKHPYLHINPAKVEMLSDTPPIYQFYDVVGDKEIKRIKEIATPSLSLSISTVDSVEVDGISELGTSVSTAILHPDLENVMKYAGFITGLKVLNSSEPTHIMEYTYGRFYNVHSDAFGVEEYKSKSYGDRIATILYYVPELGGTTSFCDAGVASNMVRGSAIFWYNMHRNGTLIRALHGACPVVHGHKIIINHWVLYAGNFEKYKCSLNQFE